MLVDAEPIARAVEQALRALYQQDAALRRLANHYPEAHHILSSPRKSDAIVILERVYYALRAQEQPAAAAEGDRGGGNDG